MYLKKMSMIGKVWMASAALLTLSSAASAQDGKVEGLQLLERVKLPGSLRSYQAAAPTDAQLKLRAELGHKLAEQRGLRFEQEALRESDGRLAFTTGRDPSAVFELEMRSANLLFNAGLAEHRKEETTPALPSARSMPELARRALSELGLTLSDKEIRDVKVGGLNMAVPDGRGGSVVYEKFRTVRFERSLDGLPVEGDSRTIVRLGSGGALEGLIYQWPAIGKARTLESGELLREQDIREAALKQIEEVVGDAKRAALTTADLVLYDDGRGHIEPAFHFVVQRHFDDRRAQPIPFDFYVPTLRAPKAVFPQHELAAVAPRDGRDESPAADKGDD